MSWRVPRVERLRKVFEQFDEDRFCEAGYLLESDDDPVAMTRETVREQRWRFEFLTGFQQLLAANELTPKQAAEMAKERKAMLSVYEGMYVSYAGAFGLDASDKLQLIVEANPPDFHFNDQLN